MRYATWSAYEEEVRLLEWAWGAGLDAGFVASESAPSLAAVRNNLLFDTFVDLRDGRGDAAREKLRFAAARLPGFDRHPIAWGVGLCARFRTLGVPLLRLGLALVLRFPGLARA